jgi:hypothetical protein
MIVKLEYQVQVSPNRDMSPHFTIGIWSNIGYGRKLNEAIDYYNSLKIHIAYKDFSFRIIELKTTQEELKLND